MKGFYITVKNGLLDAKHFQAMGGDKDKGTVWLFLWLLDKMTIVDEEKGEGKVLGGRPVKFEEFQKDIPVSQRTYQRWVKALKEGGYIETKRTPYGLIFTVFRAFKVFGQKTGAKLPFNERDVAEDASETTGYDASVYVGRDASNNNNTVTEQEKVSKDTYEPKKDINTVIGLFKDINPSYERLFPNRGQRAAVARLLTKYGLESVTNMVLALPAIIKQPYAPRIITPVALERDLGKIQIFVEQNKNMGNSGSGKTPIIGL